MTQATIRPLRQDAARVCARSAPLFTADEVWSRTNADRRSAGETDDQDSILESGFWMATVVAFLPTVAGCFYLFLTQG
ncbi:hypothetical protein A1D31_25425 [Bradyrhizobium liaoningense]|nr:hypothetical protein A1D31_25425 [Bradyrhizobium liaoningense]